MRRAIDRRFLRRLGKASIFPPRCGRGHAEFGHVLREPLSPSLQIRFTRIEPRTLELMLRLNDKVHVGMLTVTILLLRM